MDKKEIDYHGHRSRLRDRLLNGGSDALLDHEVIEYLLALAIPRRDTKPLARALLTEFGDIETLLTADPGMIARVKGMGPTAIASLKIVQIAALRLLKTKAKKAPILAGWQALLDYLHADMAYRLTERCRLLHLDSHNRLIRDEALSEGSVDRAPIYVREVIRRAIELGSIGLILVHNHPSGDANPSEMDIQLTRSVIAAARPLKIYLHDHVIISTEGFCSMRSLGLI
ncbi:MAG: DNA repair protein RadC [Zymomonas mobilis subsp. pomaceae]|uniref:DNA repair protein RadC n=1 Tax=Zymomonas mobilis subsp. pomaceae (strain ATCC 29192 / DSM 22645 / JCM 10191 / CCUG 17912 / NBRC 13757 / NCIMB 11200 / NRRL B-4491 / Barker I) TaxID=579138 RepID=F8EVZ2_ZYMMT|nr:DNA repair protein RadC [Zymomonas mobilis]AEI37469.1 DNA repair protein RadC [Zymomonas mobilis subsp. pomaceae ATCC 29192]MDX5948836.1 DNA repair protein RadC [Zymomonas mobilis subsp. pomaceae]GEB88644.1 UPF0758 protein [Zymomonas mobilis subsp. pomaceae]